MPYFCLLFYFFFCLFNLYIYLKRNTSSRVVFLFTFPHFILLRSDAACSLNVNVLNFV